VLLEVDEVLTIGEHGRRRHRAALSATDDWFRMFGSLTLEVNSRYY
jgi:hypothetical protein